MMPKETYTFLSSRIVKEIAAAGRRCQIASCRRHVQAAVEQPGSAAGKN